MGKQNSCFLILVLGVNPKALVLCFEGWICFFNFYVIVPLLYLHLVVAFGGSFPGLFLVMFPFYFDLFLFCLYIYISLNPCLCS